MKRTVKTAFIASLPVMAGYLVLGFGFGIILQEKGYSALWALPMSITMYAGAMQYVSVDLLASGASLITAAITTLLVNARHLFYGITLIEPYKNAGKLKPYMIFGLTDETYSLVCSGKAPEGVNFHRYAFFLTLFNHIYWIAGGVLGALTGALVSISFKGVDFAMTALFITVFVEQWKSTKNHIPALIGIASSLICLIIFGADNFLIPSMALISLFLFLGRRFIERKEEKSHE